MRPSPIATLLLRNTAKQSRGVTATQSVTNHQSLLLKYYAETKQDNICTNMCNIDKAYNQLETILHISGCSTIWVAKRILFDNWTQSKTRRSVNKWAFSARIYNWISPNDPISTASNSHGGMTNDCDRIMRYEYGQLENNPSTTQARNNTYHNNNGSSNNTQNAGTSIKHIQLIITNNGHMYLQDINKIASIASS